MTHHFLVVHPSETVLRLVQASVYVLLAPTGTKACDAAGGAFRPD
jgi:hypothetical protein